MGVFKRIKQLFTGGDKMNTFSEVNQSALLSLYDDFIMSDKYKWMQIGKRYYEGKHDILDRKLYKYTPSGTPIEDNTQPNNKIYFNYAKFITEQKVDYLLSKAPTVESPDENYQILLEAMFEDNDFDYLLGILGTESSNSGTGWLQPYVDATGEFKFQVVPANQCVPIWKDDLHSELSAMIRVYNILENTDLADQIESTIYEYWTETGMKKFKSQDSNLIQMNNTSLLNTLDGDSTGFSAHYTSNNLLRSWGKVPFIAFKNNNIEQPDIKDIKSQIDAMNLSLSDVVNALEQQRDRILIIENASGTSPEEINNNIKLYGIAFVENSTGEGSKINVLNTPMNPEGTLNVYNTLKSSLLEIGHAANTNQDWKVPPAGIALELLYRELDIKCNKFEKQFRKGFKELQYFYIQYLDIVKNIKVSEKAKITFNKDMPQNNAEQLNQISTGLKNGTLSQKSAVHQSPLVDNPVEELSRLHLEYNTKMKNENKGHFDTIPFK